MNSWFIVGHIERRPIHQLSMYAQNARTHSDSQIGQIAASIREFGFVNPILIAPDNTIIAGHARWQAAGELGMAEVPVIVLAHLSNAQRRALVVADNQLAANAGWDEQKLHLELAALQAEAFDLNLLGFDDGALERLLAEQEADGLLDPDAVPPIPPLPTTVPGDLWLLGNHRLLCGDATSREAIDRVVASEPVRMVFTDPPYAVRYQGKTSQKLTIQNDALGEGFGDFLRLACANLIAVCQGAIYICMSSSQLHTLYQAFTEAGGHWSTFVIWAKQHFTLGRSDYQRQYEPILYGWPQGAKHYWCGDRNQGDVWFIARPLANREHPTMKPVELVERALDNSSRTGDPVLDPFAGSGTTLIACQRRKRRARLIEIDPRYVEVICQRWQQYTGKAAVLDGDGRTFDAIVQARQRKAA
ncbi:MAG: site-specific DNA-methyltransferase [Bryobacteraceae bacterium]